MIKTTKTILAALGAVTALAAVPAMAQPAGSHVTKVVVKKGPTVKKTVIRTGGNPRHHVVCRTHWRDHKKVRVCR